MAIISELATSQYLTTKSYGYRAPEQIKYFIPHHTQSVSTAANLALYFRDNGLDNSVNYCIGYKGGISCNLPEELGPWTSSWRRVDEKAITVEVSNSSVTDTNWPISDAAKEDLIRLMVDVFKRYPSLGGKALYYPSDVTEVVAARAANREPKPKGNILLHNWTDKNRKNCPGPYMTKIMPDICAEVNRRLAGGTTRTLHEEAQYMITNSINWPNRVIQAKADGFDPDDVQAEIDKMLCKNPIDNVSFIIKYLPTLTKGAKGDYVKLLQEILSYRGYLTVAVDGIFGNYTLEALKQFQSNINKVYGNFAVDGSCGPKTWSRLFLGK